MCCRALAVFFLGRRAEESITPAEAVAGYAGAQEATMSGAGTPSEITTYGYDPATGMQEPKVTLCQIRAA